MPPGTADECNCGSQPIRSNEGAHARVRLQLRKKREKKGRSGEEGEDRTQTYPGEQSKNQAAKDRSTLFGLQLPTAPCEVSATQS